MTTAKYHAGNGRPLCGQSGGAGGFYVVTLSAKDWNATKPENRCEKCCAAIRKTKRAWR